MQNCPSCLKVKLSSCNAGITLSAGLTPGQDYKWIITDKFDNKYSADVMADYLGRLFIDPAELPNGFFSPYSGEFNLIIEDEDKKCVPLAICDEYECLNILITDSTVAAITALIGDCDNGGGASAQIQSDFDQTETAALDYIKHKPTKLSDFINDLPSTITGAENGLSLVGANVVWGGPLNNSVAIDGNHSVNFGGVTPLSEYIINAANIQIAGIFDLTTLLGASVLNVDITGNITFNKQSNFTQSVKISDGSQGNNFVFKSDVSGNGQWDSITNVLGYTPYDAANPAGYISTISGITAGGDLSGTYPDPTILNSAVIGKVLTGLNITGGSIAASDTILQGFGKLQNQVNGVLGGAIYEGVWNATTNSPTLVSSTGTKGFYYVVNVAGSTSLDGITDWKVGDWAIFNGATWDKVDNTDAVSSVNTFTGAVNLTTANISEITNLYYTNGRGIGSVLTGYVSGAGTVAATDSILQAIQKLNGNISGLVTGVSSVTGTTNRITSSGGATPAIDISANYVGQSTITTLGTITTGVWTGTSIADGNIATSYIKSDGTRALTANWGMGAFKATSTFTSVAAASFNDSFEAINTTTATSGNQMYGGFYTSEGRGFGTTAGTSQSVISRWGTTPVQGAVPTGQLLFQSSIAGSAFATLMTLDSSGGLLTTTPSGLKILANNTGVGGLSFSGNATANTITGNNGFKILNGQTASAAASLLKIDCSGFTALASGVGIGVDFATASTAFISTGSGTYSHLNIPTTITQTGGGSGITRSVYVNPTLTNVADYRAIEVALGRSLFAACVAAYASITLPHGTTPTTLNNGDMWTTTSGLFVRINGVTKTVTLT